MAERVIQLANNLDKLSSKALATAFASGGWASEKLDGVWVAVICKKGDIRFVSSSGEDVRSLLHTPAWHAVRDMLVSCWHDFVLIAEAYKDGLPQADISGMFRKQVAGHAKELELHVHDHLTIEEWEAAISPRPYSQRLQALVAVLEGCESRHLRIIPVRRVNSAEDLKSIARIVQGGGGEGVCYRPDDAGWAAGNRGTNLIRIKEKITYDLEVLGVYGVEEGDKGGLKGVLQVRWRQFGSREGTPSVQDVRGMTHAQLREWAANPSLIVGKIVEVEAMKLTAYGTLREPRFKSVREDKLTADL